MRRYSYCTIGEADAAPYLVMRHRLHRGRADIDEYTLDERRLEDDDPEIYEAHEFDCNSCTHKLACLMDPLTKVFYKKV